jgi:hypothetical protein
MARRKRKNPDFMKTLTTPMGLGVSISGVLAGAAIMWFYGDMIKGAMGPKESGAVPPTAGELGALAFARNPMHMGALAFAGAEAPTGAHGQQGAHSFGALHFNNPRRMGRRY